MRPLEHAELLQALKTLGSRRGKNVCSPEAVREPITVVGPYAISYSGVTRRFQGLRRRIRCFSFLSTGDSVLLADVPAVCLDLVREETISPALRSTKSNRAHKMGVGPPGQRIERCRSEPDRRQGTQVGGGIPLYSRCAEKRDPSGCGLAVGCTRDQF